ncbi:MAG TPA: hypothetical protein ENO19_09595, partial [Halothiobacillaceae bacterium]|nr:hypothetical protein [Halothiobacillaceae bacterium]
MRSAFLTALVWLRRLVLVAGWSAVVLALLAAVAGWWLTATPAGVQWALGQADRHISALSIGASRGTLWRGLALEQIDWVPEQGASARIGETRVRIDPKALWHGALRLPELVVRDARIALPPADPSAPSPPPGEPFDPDDLDLPPLSLALERVVIDRLVVVRGDQRYAVERGRLTAAMDARIDRPELQVDLDALDLRLPDDMRLDARANVTLEPAGQMPVAGHVDLLFDHPQGWLSGRVDAGGDLLGKLDLQPRLAWMGADGVPAALCGRLRVDQDKVAIEQAVVDGLGGRVAFAGTAAWAPTARIELNGRGESLDPAWVSPGSPASPASPASPRTSGSLSFDFDTDLAVSDGWLPVAGRLSVNELSGELAGESLESVAIDLNLDERRAEAQVSGRAGGGKLHLDGRLDAERRLRADWQIDALPLAGGAAGGTDGIGSITLASRGRLDAELPDWNRPLTAADWLSSLQARLEDVRLELVERRREDSRRAITLELAAGLDQARLAIDRLTLDAPGAALDVSGALGLDPDWAQWRLEDVQGRLAVPDLAALPWDLVERLPAVDLSAFKPRSARGGIDVELAASGPILAPAGDLDARIDGLRLAGYSLDRARAAAVIDPADGETALLERRMQVSLDAGTLAPERGEPLFDQLTFTAQGNPSSHRVELEVDGPLELGLGARGGWQPGDEAGEKTDGTEAPGWRGQLTRLELVPT